MIKTGANNMMAILKLRLCLLQNLGWILSGRNIIFSLFMILLNQNIDAKEQNNHFDFSRYLTGPLQTLSVEIQDINSSTGQVVAGGYDSQCPTIAFTWNWGDGTINEGWFPKGHTYSDLTKNYLLRVTAHYSDGKTDSTDLTVRFVPPIISPISLPSDITVSIPDSDVILTSHMPGYTAAGLSYFDDSFFNIIPRSTVEYILTLVAYIQKDFVNDNMYLIDGKFEQLLLRDADFGGMYSLWFTNPVSFGVGDYGFQGTIQWSSFFHEMGHNFTLNTPADYYFGGKIDGDANAIYSETMAQIFQHATAYEIINNASTYGLSEDIIADIKQSAVNSVKIIRDSYENYIISGMNFASWNDPGTPDDDTFNTFMTIAYKYLEHAESSESGYRITLKRMLLLLQAFNQNLKYNYNQCCNTAEADTFRSTLMVTALSFAFSTDLRNEFRDLNFPISDETYFELMEMADGIENTDNPILYNFTLNQNYPNPFNPTTTIEFCIPVGKIGQLFIINISGQMLESHRFRKGNHRFYWDGTNYASGVYFYKLEMGNYSEVRKMLLMK